MARPPSAISLSRAPPWRVGETHLTIATLRYHLELPSDARRLGTGKFVAPPELLDDLRAGHEDEENTYEQRLRRYKECGLLVLDDIGSERGTEWAREKLLQLVDYRYLRRLPMLFTLNPERARMEPRLADRVDDRRQGKVIRLKAPATAQGGTGNGHAQPTLSTLARSPLKHRSR